MKIWLSIIMESGFSGEGFQLGDDNEYGSSVSSGDV